MVSDKGDTLNAAEVLKPLLALEQQINKIQQHQNEQEHFDRNRDEIRLAMRDLTHEVNKLVSVNLNLQSKMVEVLVRFSDVSVDLKELIKIMKEELEGGDEGEYEESRAPIQMDGQQQDQINLLIEQNKALSTNMEELQKYLRRMYRRNLFEQRKNA